MKYILSLLLLWFVSGLSVFAQETKIHLDEKYLLGNFKLYISDDYIITLDNVNSTCYFFNKQTGDFDREINPQNSFPGFNWRPIKLEVVGEDIFFTNSGPWAFLISKNNTNVRVFDKTFLPPNGFKIVSDSTLVGFYTKLDGTHSLKKFNIEGSLLKEFELPDLNAKYLLYRIENFYLHQFDEKIYFINPLDNLIYKYSETGDLLGEIRLKIPSFDKVNKDINPRADVNQMLPQVIKTIRTKSYIHSSYKLDEPHLLLIVKHTENNAALVVFDLIEDRIVKVEKITYEDIPDYVHNNKFYHIRPTEENYMIIEKEFSY